MTLRNICVYCGSNPGRNPIYVEQARTLACALVERRIGLVFGGAQVGVMGVMADTVLRAGGIVTGVIPQTLVDKEVAHMGLTELVITDSMHERKMIMAERSDGFIALPGGIGTLEELFEVWTWAQLAFHRKPCGILNVAGYYDGLARFLDHAVAEGFVKTPHREMLFIETDPSVLLDCYEQYTPPNVEKWLRRAKM